MLDDIGFASSQSFSADIASRVLNNKSMDLTGNVKNVIILLPNEGHESPSMSEEARLINQPYVPENLEVSPGTNIPDLKSGTFRSGAHGWFVFLKPLPPGDHTLYYNVGVTGTGPNDHSAEITYDLKVK